MTTRILTGSKQQIADQLAKLEGDVREAIVFIQEPAAETAANGTAPPTKFETAEDFFREMDAYTVKVGHVDDSREAIYTRQEGE